MSKSNKNKEKSDLAKRWASNSNNGLKIIKSNKSKSPKKK